MKLMLDLPIRKSPCLVGYTDKIMMIGSCFSSEIGERLDQLMFTVLQNPCGILYDPLSISSCLQSCLTNKVYHAEDLIYNNELWHSWQHHSSFSGINPQDVIDKINDHTNKAHAFLKESKWLIITLGTSFAYRLTSTNKSIANCHKFPSAHFHKDFITIEQSIASMEVALTALRIDNPGIKIILTVSPVKHIKDGIEENSHSKARLLEVVHSLEERFEHLYYFPAFEIVTDVLRDYRFYKEDLVHPNKMAIDVVFEQFSQSFISPEDRNIMKEVKALVDAGMHRPMHQSTKAFESFRNALLEKASSLRQRYPFLDLGEWER